MKKYFIPIIITLLCSCSPTPTATIIPISRIKPDDFQVQYAWSAGSLPPPYAYKYTITLGPEARGEIVFVPGYSNDGPLTWIETWEMAGNDFDQLYTMLFDAGAFTQSWSQVDDIPDGGSADDLLITAYDRQFSIPSYVAGDQQAKDINAVYHYIGTLVPQATWDKLNAQHEQYIKAHEDEE